MYFLKEINKFMLSNIMGQILYNKKKGKNKFFKF